MPFKKDLKKVMVIGSGPIVIGQAAEFDYAGTQACQALKEEGLEVVLINSNPATIMTDAHMADRIYIEPLTPEFVRRVLIKEKPDGLIASLGGQVGLNMALTLAREGILAETGVPLLGTPLEAIMKAEDRELFKETMKQLHEPIPQSAIVDNVEDAVAFGEKTGYPLIVRPAYTLGGTGGGVVKNRRELIAQAAKGLKMSIIKQILVEQSVAGYKEIEFEVMRDAADNCITICSMENIDAVGIHTGDSIVIAPAQTLDNVEYEMLRAASIRIIRALGIAGGCNIQFALDPVSRNYYVIEVNPRVSRSSALASKATGYPIARVTTKIAVGYNLDEIRNDVTGTTSACFEPTVDYVVMKVPRWPFDKFAGGDRLLGTQMKATGEVMAIDRTIEGAFLKAFRSLEVGIAGIRVPEMRQVSDQELEHRLEFADDERFYLLYEAFERGMPVEELHNLTKIDRFFLRKVENIVRMAGRLSREELSPELLREAKRMGFADAEIASLAGRTEGEVRAFRKSQKILPTYKIVDTCAAEIEAQTPYFYSTYEEEDEAGGASDRRKIMVIGSGPIRIGQGIEFDYCSVHCVWALREAGIEAVIANNNPETVSTDFDTADRLFFEPLVFEDVMNIIEEEEPEGVIVQFGGQTAINLAAPLATAGVKILGTSVDDIDRAEDRDRFDLLVESLGIPRPKGRSVHSEDEAVAAARDIGYPVLVRPSYVLGGRAMEIVYNEDELRGYMATAVKASREHPVLIDKYLQGREMEVDAISDGEDVLIPGIMQHVERAGVHSGDSIAVYPPAGLSPRIEDKVVAYTEKLARALKVKGMLNIQFVEFADELYVIEVNPRSSRTVPFLSKATGVPMVKLATAIILGHSLKELGYAGGLVPSPGYYAVKVPVFSFAKLGRVDVSLGPEMKSTGEVMGIDPSLQKALYKGLLAAGFSIPRSGTVLATIADKDKEEALPILRSLVDTGFSVMATCGTARFLKEHGIEVEKVNKINEGSPTVVDMIRQDRVDLVINTLSHGRKQESDGFAIRRAAVEMGIPCMTSLDTARVFLRAMQEMSREEEMPVAALQDYLNQKNGLGGNSAWKHSGETAWWSSTAV